jgi:hypothetical protein
MMLLVVFCAGSRRLPLVLISEALFPYGVIAQLSFGYGACNPAGIVMLQLAVFRISTLNAKQ